MKKKYEEECRILYLRLNESQTVTERIYNELYYHEEAIVPMAEIASNMNISSRTLRRYLYDEGITYQTILSNVLKNKAIDFLTTTELTIEKIAEKLGYSDTANFYHAFKKWTGNLPSSYRHNKKRFR